MNPLRIMIFGRRILSYTVLSALILVAALSYLIARSTLFRAVDFKDPQSKIIVIDAGHGGIDGGANKNGLLEKDVNLAVAQKLKVLLEQDGYEIVMTRDADISLDHLNASSSSRHKRDLNARLSMINSSRAQLFISIHVNSNANDPSADGSIVFFNSKFQQNKTLAYYIQRAMNEIPVNGRRRTEHTPLQGNYFLLKHSDIPGVIVETAYLSNSEEKILLYEDSFRGQLAAAIAGGIEQYLHYQSYFYIISADT